MTSGTTTLMSPYSPMFQITTTIDLLTSPLKMLKYYLTSETDTPKINSLFEHCTKPPIEPSTVNQVNTIMMEIISLDPTSLVNGTSFQLSLMYKKKMINPTIKNSSSFLHILLLLGGDVHSNPGPKNITSLIQGNETDIQEITVTCQTCQQQTNLQCTIQPQDHTNHMLNRSFNWVCPSPSCYPNHYVPDVKEALSQQTDSINHQNKYTILQRPAENKEENYSKKKSPRKRKENVKRLPRKKNDNLWSELTKIDSKAYIGKDICISCNSYVQKSQITISCNTCLRLTHRKCTDMSMKKYREYQKKKKLKPHDVRWTCLKCRNEDVINYSKFNKALCSENQLPDEWEDVMKGKGQHEEIFFHFNARSMVDKADEIEEVAINFKPAAIFVTESWLDQSCPMGTAVPENYTIIRKDRSEEFKQKYGKTNGGGVAVLIRRGVEIKAETKLMDDRNEILWCTLKIEATKYLIGIVYRGCYTELLKSDQEGNTEMEDLLQKTVYHNLILIGDFNCDTSKPESSPDTKTLVQLAEEYNLKNLIEKPTRFCETTATTIDHIWVREESGVWKAGTCQGLSDHCGIYCYIKAEIVSEDEEITCRNYKSFNPESYKEDVKKFVDESNFRVSMQNKDINTAFNSWLESLQKAANKHAPYKTFKPKRNDTNIPWFNAELREITTIKNMHLKLYRLYHNPEDKEKYKAAKNKQTHLKKKFKREYYTKKINEYVGDSRKMWNILKDVTNNNYREDISPDIVNEETANRFNKFFSNVGMKVQKMLHINIKPPKLNSKGIFLFQPESTEKIEKLIKRIKPDVATGIDGLSAKLIKEATPVIVEDLKEMVNLSYETETFPDQLKIATVKALHKKGDNNDPAQYRPISILTVISKIFERSAVDQLVTYYNRHNLLNPQQHAYRKFHSTTTSLFELTETIKKHIDNGNFVALAALDLSKAFDSLAHNLILSKLNEMGLNSRATSWIKSYLSNRKQMVKFGKIKSTIENIESGVPQGSILGPLLFISCTNDIYSELLEYDLFTYADDMQIVIAGKNVKELGKLLEDGIQMANKYYNNNSLLCNPTKTEIMLLGTKMRLSNADQLEVKVTNGEETKILKGEKSLKLLGVHIDQSLDWDNQTKQVKKRAVNSIRNLHRVNDLLPIKQKRLLYTSLVTPHFSYADIIWNKCGKSNSNRIQQAQNYAAKSMLGLSKFTSSTEALKKLQLIPLAEKRKINLAVHVKNSLEGRAPENVQKLYQKQTSNMNNRAAETRTLNYPMHKLQQYQNGALYASIKVWNTIPVNLRNNPPTNFKKNLQSYMTKQYLGI